MRRLLIIDDEAPRYERAHFQQGRAGGDILRVL